MAVGDVYEIVKAGQVANADGDFTQIRNVFHYKVFTQVVDVDKASIQTLFNTQVGARMRALLSDQYAELWDSVRLLNDPTDPAEEITMSGTGAVTGHPVAPHTCIRMRLKTGKRGRSYFGSKSFSPLDQSYIANAEMADAAHTNAGLLQSGIAANLTEDGGNTYIPVVLSRKLSDLTATVPTIVATPINLVDCNIKLGTQRRRKDPNCGQIIFFDTQIVVLQ